VRVIVGGAQRPVSRRTALAGLAGAALLATAGCGGSPSGGSGSGTAGKLGGRASRWSHDFTGSADESFTPKAVTLAGGTVYAGQNGKLFALDAATGKLRWTSPDGPVDGPASGWWYAPVVSDGMVYVAGNPGPGKPGTLYAVSAGGGGQKWRLDAKQSLVPPPAAGGGLVYVSVDGSLRALDATTGTQRWQLASSGANAFTAPIVAGGVVVVADSAGILAGLDAATGTRRWTHTASDGVTAPTWAAAGGVLYACANTQVRAYDLATGAPKWTSAVDARLDPGNKPLTVAGGTVFVPGDARVQQSARALTALDAATGRTRWTFTTGEKAYVEGPAAVDGGTVYLGSERGLYAVDAATGTRKWVAAAGNATAWGPAAGGGRVYVFVDAASDDPSYSDHLYALPT
jgi:outer membrane protein assembly factor BamB